MPEEGAAPRAAPSSSVPYYRVPPTFGGKAGEDADEWLVHYKRVSKSNGWDSTAQLTNVVFSLTDTALVWYENHEEALTTWELFVEELKACFGDSVAKKKRAEQTLSQRAQLPGAAVSGVFVGVQVLVSQHFEKRRATACSLMFTVCGLNMFFAAPLVDLFRVTYGIRGAFLLLGGLILNACPAAIVVRNPTWMQVKDAPSTCKKDETYSSNNQMSVEAPLLTLYSEKQERDSEQTKAVLESKTEVPVPKEPVGPNYARNLRNFCAILRSTTAVKEAEEGILQDLTANARRFATPRFALDALSFSIIIFGLTTFFLLYVDIATDRGVIPSRAAFLVYAFAAGDLVCRALSGVIIDSELLTLDSVMLFGYVLQAAGFELFVWLRTFPTMLVCSALIGVSNGLRHSLQAPLLVRDFGIEHLPVMMGGLSFCNGVVLLTRPMLVGYYRDQQGSYDGLLHIAAIVNAAFCFLWAIRIFSERTRHWARCGHSKQRQEELGFS